MSAISAGVACLAAGLAAGSGYNCWMWFERMRQKSRHRERVLKADAESAQTFGDNSSFDAKVIEIMERETIAELSGARVPAFLEPFLKSGWMEKNVRYAGLDGSVSEKAFCVVRLKLAFALAAAGLVFGLCFSGGMAAVLAMVGFFFGFMAPKRAVSHRKDWRTQQMERHLPEMLDVVAIGMRSGLSFDRSLQIYSERFSTFLAKEFALAERKWTSGLERRDTALRQLAETYDSLVFERVTESVIRSLRFGTSMVEGLEAAAREARVSYRTKKQMQVAKAPVKMMIPTGTLILPAMLILVMGPVLLELIGGGI